MEDAGNNRIELRDEDGNDIPFEHLMTLEHQGCQYVVLEAVEDMEDCLEGEAIILKIIQDENGEDVYATIEDEKELQEVFQKCLSAIEEMDEPEDGDAGDDEA